jgi:hypothetical protein
MATACYITSYRVSGPEMTSPWVAKASSERNPIVWSIMAASRLTQTGEVWSDYYLQRFHLEFDIVLTQYVINSMRTDFAVP